MSLGFRVFTEVERPPRELVEEFTKIPTPDLVDCMNKAGMVDGHIRPIYQPMLRFAGPAVTISVPTGSFSIKKMGLEMTRPGDVVVIAARGTTHFALLGGNIAIGLKHRGVAGMIVDGAVRDAKQMQEAGFPVHAFGLALISGPKTEPGEVNVPVAFGHCVIFPGDIIVADEEGIAVVPPAYAESVLQQVAKVQAWHAEIQPVLEQGEITNIVTIRESLEESGCEFVPAPWQPR